MEVDVVTEIEIRRLCSEVAAFSMAAPMMAKAMRRANAKDLARLKELLDQGRPSQP